MSICYSFRNVEVLQPLNHPLYKFTLYKVVYRNVDCDDSVEITIYKRYSEFRKLYEQMHAVHLNLYRTNQFPNFVTANFFDRFDKEVIELRRKSSEDLLKFICENKHLHNHKIFKDFLNCGVRKSIDKEKNILDHNLDSFDFGRTLQSPILPVSLRQQQGLSIDRSTPTSPPDQRLSLNPAYQLLLPQCISLDESRTSNQIEDVDIKEDQNMSKSTSSLDMVSDDGVYLEHASEIFKNADKMELDNDWESALRHYENGIEILLKGAKMDKNRARVSMIHKEVKLYLDKAELINAKYVANIKETDDDILLRLLDQCTVLKTSNHNEVMYSSSGRH